MLPGHWAKWVCVCERRVRCREETRRAWAGALREQ